MERRAGQSPKSERDEAMRAVLCLTLVASVLIVAGAAPADTVTLATGGKVEGAVDEIVFLQKGVSKTLRRDEFAVILLDREDPDKVTLNDGTIHEGELVSLQVKSVGGLLTFKRAELSAVAIAKVSLDRLRKEYLLRRAKVKDDDSSGLYGLAVWCKEKGLVAEARDLARRCLDAKPEPETEVLAHRLLGHVLRGGKWVKPGAPTEPKKVVPDTKPKNTNADKRIAPALLAHHEKLTKAYAQAAKHAKSKDWETIKSTYQAKWDKSQTDSRKLKASISKTKKEKDDLQDDIRAEKKRGEGGYPNNPKTNSEWRRKDRIDDLRRDYDRAKRDLDRIENRYDRIRKERRKLAAVIKAQQTKARRRAAERKQNVEDASAEIDRLLHLGKKFSEADMKAIFDKALQE